MDSRPENIFLQHFEGTAPLSISFCCCWDLWRKDFCSFLWSLETCGGLSFSLGFPGGSLEFGRSGFDPWVRKFPWGRKWQPAPPFLPAKSHGRRSLAGYSPWGHKESDTTERFCFLFSFSSVFSLCNNMPWLGQFPSALLRTWKLISGKFIELNNSLRQDGMERRVTFVWVLGCMNWSSNSFILSYFSPLCLFALHSGIAPPFHLPTCLLRFLFLFSHV